MLLGFHRLRNATEDDVKAWLKGAFAKLPIETPAELAELLNSIAEIEENEGSQPREASP